jgi:hypothetical protein
MRSSALIALVVAHVLVQSEFTEETAEGKHHHHKHHGKHHHKHGLDSSAAEGANASSAIAQKVASSATVGMGATSVAQILGKMKVVENEMAAKDAAENKTSMSVDIKSMAAPIKMLKVSFDKKDTKADDQVQAAAQPANADAAVSVDLGRSADTTATQVQASVGSVEPCSQDIDIDTDMPYGELEPFGREDTAQELTESSITESDEMVDQLERAEVAEEKRAVFRALTRLRGAAITSFDGVARSQTGNIDEYNKVHKWRMTHPLRHLADEESDISKWAFPDNADF